MSTSSCKPVLLVFTRGPRRERRFKRLLPRGLGRIERALHDQTLLETVRSGRKLGCRIVVSCPDRLDLPVDVECVAQSGRTFGERFADALDRVGAYGAGPVLVVGTDTPGLDTALLRDALSQLESAPSRVVVGPTLDGGFYLLAMNQNEAPIDWQKISWCSNRTRKTLCSTIESSGLEVRYLEPQVDLDRAPDLERWLARGRISSALRHTVTELVALLAERLRPEWHAQDRLAEAPVPTGRLGRAPPR